MRKNSLKEKSSTLGIYDLWTVDIVVMPNRADTKGNYICLLNVIDDFSKCTLLRSLYK